MDAVGLNLYSGVLLFTFITPLLRLLHFRYMSSITQTACSVTTRQADDPRSFDPLLLWAVPGGFRHGVFFQGANCRSPYTVGFHPD